MGGCRKLFHDLLARLLLTDGKKYLSEDLKGKGEPSFTIEKALKEQKLSDHRRVLSDGNSYEMQSQNGSLSSRQRSASGSNAEIISNGKPSGDAMRSSDLEGEVRRRNTTGRRVGEGLKRRFGSLRRSKKTSDVNV
jgi:hypothetical protein